MKKIIALSLALIMLLCCLAGCSPKYEEDTVMTVDGVEISWDEYVFWISYAAMYLEYNYSMYGMPVDWLSPQQDGRTNAQWCVEYAEQTVIQKGIIDAKCAEMGISLTEEEESEVEKSIDDYKTQCCGEGATDEQFEAYLKTNQNSSIAVLRSSQRTSALTNKLFTELYGENGENVDDEELLAKAEEQGYTKANHILFLFSDENGEPRSESEIAAGKAQLEGFIDELNAIEDTEERYARFCELKEQYCEDNGTEAYQFAEGVMVDEFYAMSLELGEYELGIVESTYGYHLMIGLPLDLDYSVTAQSSTPISLRDTLIDGMYTAQLAEWEDEAEVEYVGDFENFDFTSMFTENGFIYQSWADRNAEKSEE